MFGAASSKTPNIPLSEFTKCWERKKNKAIVVPPKKDLGIKMRDSAVPRQHLDHLQDSFLLGASHWRLDLASYQ